MEVAGDLPHLAHSAVTMRLAASSECDDRNKTQNYIIELTRVKLATAS